MGRHKGYKHSEETKQKISQKTKGRKMQPFTEEHRAKIGAAHKGQVPANKGCKLVMVNGKRTYRRIENSTNFQFVKKED